LAEGVIVTGVLSTVSVNEVAVEMDCVKGSVTTGKVLWLSALEGAPAVIT